MKYILTVSHCSCMGSPSKTAGYADGHTVVVAPTRLPEAELQKHFLEMACRRSIKAASVVSPTPLPYRGSPVSRAYGNLSTAFHKPRAGPAPGMSSDDLASIDCLGCIRAIAAGRQPPFHQSGLPAILPSLSALLQVWTEDLHVPVDNHQSHAAFHDPYVSSPVRCPLLDVPSLPFLIFLNLTT